MTVEVISDVGLGKASRFVSWQSERQTNRFAELHYFSPNLYNSREIDIKISSAWEVEIRSKRRDSIRVNKQRETVLKK